MLSPSGDSPDLSTRYGRRSGKKYRINILGFQGPLSSTHALARSEIVSLPTRDDP